MSITLVVAISSNGVIGREGALPWRLSSDLRRFRETTMGKPVVMGRKTWESLPKRPLPGRRSIVVTRDASYVAGGAETALSLLAALELAEGEEVCVIGGGEIFAEALPLADRLDVTHVLGEFDGDAFFPPVDWETWQAVSVEEVPASAKDSHPTRHAVYRRPPRR